MRNLLIKIGVGVLLVAIIIICTIILKNQNKTKIEGSFTLIVINIEEIEVVNRIIPYKKNDTLFKVIKSNYEDLIYQEGDYGVFIEGIAGIDTRGSKRWLNILVDGSDSLGISSISLRDGMVISLVEKIWE